ncbi:TPA: ead/Ea22-like family protein [Enterobacter hormaechei subsp. steigerwaltii]|nr:ead/Ea22-like family protein [Enterobacter hormaechei subsp. steigerwaltii]
MSNIDKQAVQAVADLKAGYTLGHADVEIIQQMALDAVTLMDELEAKEKRIAELEAIAKSVKFHPIPMEDLGNKSDGKKHPYMFGAGYNSAVVHCESVLLQAFAAAAGKGA